LKRKKSHFLEVQPHVKGFFFSDGLDEGEMDNEFHQVLKLQ